MERHFGGRGRIRLVNHQEGQACGGGEKKKKGEKKQAGFL